jgi:hypothetical protein
MSEHWSPFKAAAVVAAIVVAIGTVVSIVVMSLNGVLDDKPFERGQMIGIGLCTLGAIAGAVAYFIQARRERIRAAARVDAPVSDPAKSPISPLRRR